MNPEYMCPCGCRMTWEDAVKWVMKHMHKNRRSADEHLHNVAKRLRRPAP